MSFNGSVSIGAGQFRTLQELIAAAVATRTYTSAQIKAEAISRLMNQLGINGGYITPAAIGLYMIDAYKGVRNGVVTSQADWAAIDFTASPGGGQPLPAAALILLPSSVATRVIYNSTGAPITIYVDV
jgi:hypothetical protein